MSTTPPDVEASLAGVTVKLRLTTRQVDEIVAARLRALLANNPEQFAKYIRHHVEARWLTMTIHTGEIIATGDAYLPEDSDGAAVLAEVCSAVATVIDRHGTRIADTEDKWS